VADLAELLQPGDLLVVNDTRVRRARLFARRPSGGRVELFFLEPEPGRPGRWRALANPARKLRVGEPLELELPEDAGRVPGWRLVPVERLPHDAEPEKPGPTWVLDFEQAAGAAPEPAAIEALFERAGHVPLPPYIARQQGQGAAEADHEALDAERYQTVFARELGAVAAPTAGLHLSEELLARLDARGVERASVTLHVGLGTFAAVEVEDTEAHPMHAERYQLSEATVAAVARARDRGGRVVCVGTTSVRVLESCVDAAGELRAGSGSTRLFLTPGSRFHVCDVLLTNFHLPRSTLLMLVAAFVGRERALALYAEAIEQRYRFYSYGDAMLLTRPR
jgi:S-adenosylmethionine:tRNA ribosyltransferase-isomerase